MATVSPVLRSLASPSDSAPVFEPDQVLTHGQLNRLSDWFDDQGRLTRVQLIGVGLVDGLVPALEAGQVRVGAGLGLSTDGDLIALGQSTLFTGWRPYDRDAPRYEPFYTDADTLFPIVELVAPGDADLRTRPLAELDLRLEDQVVVALMESVENDPDLCTGGDCDNLGRDALHRLRWLLLRSADASALLARERALLPACQRAASLPAVHAQAPRLQGLSGTVALANACREAANATLALLGEALAQLATQFPERLRMVCGRADAPLQWRADLQALASQAAERRGGLQQWQAFVADLAETWQALRDTLLQDDSVALPDFGAFPKHLLLGQLGAPRQLRSGLYPSPASGGTRDAAAHASFLMWTLQVLVGSFHWPTDSTLRVTPSRSAAGAALEERAIPWYYRIDRAAPVQVAWNYRRAARGLEADNLGYRAADYAPPSRPAALDRVLAGHDFFRIEGHLGRPVREVRDALRRLVVDKQLPFTVRAVLLHTERTPGLLRPPVRFTDLHRLHHLLRQDVQLQIADSIAHGRHQVEALDRAIQDKTAPATLPGRGSVLGRATDARDSVSQLQEKAAPALGAPRYLDYRAVGGGPAPAWISEWTSSLNRVGQMRVDLGELSRQDFSAAYDNLLTTNRPHWLQWLDQLIDQRDDEADQRLLFSRFASEFPGLAHQGGVPRGGSFVLLYDDQGQVVGDVALDGWHAEDGQDSEPDLPPLKVLPIRPEFVLGQGIRVIKPLDIDLGERLLGLKDEVQKDWTARFGEQKGYIDGIFKFAQLPKGGFDTGLSIDTGNGLLDAMTREVQRLQDVSREAQQVLARPDLPERQRAQAQAFAERSRNELADAIVRAGQAALDADIELGAGSRAAPVLGVLTQGITQVGGGAAAAKLSEQLGALKGGTASQVSFAQGLQRVGMKGF